MSKSLDNNFGYFYTHFCRKGLNEKISFLEFLRFIEDLLGTTGTVVKTTKETELSESFGENENFLMTAKQN